MNERYLPSLERSPAHSTNRNVDIRLVRLELCHRLKFHIINIVWAAAGCLDSYLLNSGEVVKSCFYVVGLHSIDIECVPVNTGYCSFLRSGELPCSPHGGVVKGLVVGEGVDAEGSEGCLCVYLPAKSQEPEMLMPQLTRYVLQRRFLRLSKSIVPYGIAQLSR